MGKSYLYYLNNPSVTLIQALHSVILRDRIMKYNFRRIHWLAGFFLVTFFTGYLPFARAQHSLNEVMATWPEETMAKCRIVSLENQDPFLAEVLLLCNMARVDGPRFARDILPLYFLEHGGKDTEAAVSLLNELNQLPSLPPFSLRKELMATAAYFAEYAGARGIVAHDRFDQRYDPLLKSCSSVAENLYFGYKKTALNVVAEFRIIEGVPGCGHRVNLLSGMLIHMGMAYQPNKKYDFILVMSLGACQ